jgi:hypothetical protein
MQQYQRLIAFVSLWVLFLGMGDWNAAYAAPASTQILYAQAVAIRN